MIDVVYGRQKTVYLKSVVSSMFCYEETNIILAIVIISCVECFIGSVCLLMCICRASSEYLLMPCWLWCFLIYENVINM